MLTKEQKTENHRESANKYSAGLRLLVLQVYSSKVPFCSCCGEKEVKFLCIDHTDGDGNKHRKEIGMSSGSRFYAWLKRNDFPDGFQVLCHNCNMAKGFYGVCPHKDFQ